MQVKGMNVRARRKAREVVRDKGRRIRWTLWDIPEGSENNRVRYVRSVASYPVRVHTQGWDDGTARDQL